MQKIFGKLKFFSDLSKIYENSTYNEVYSQLKHEYIAKYKPVFFFGDMGRKFYILLQGRVKVLIPPERVSQKGNSFKKDLSKINFDMKIEEALNILYPAHKIVNSLKEGDTFGDISLTQNVPR